MRPPVYCATVDHGLRPESAAEAGQVARWAATLGIPHATLAWLGPKPTTRLQERARDARYGLLAEHALAIGADTLLTAHHADDQAETILFRLARGSGIGGLAGMAREVVRHDIRLARPLLDLPKTDLLAICDDAGQPYLLDPSNENPRFARARLRRLASVLEREGMGRDAWLRLGRRAARAEEALAAMFEALWTALKPQEPAQVFLADIEPFRSAPVEMTTRLLARVIEAEGGHRPRLDRLESLAQRVHDAHGRHAPLRATLGDALVRLGRDGSLKVEREGPRRPRRALNPANDRKIEGIDLHNNGNMPAPAPVLDVGSLGNRPHEA